MSHYFHVDNPFTLNSTTRTVTGTQGEPNASGFSRTTPTYQASDLPLYSAGGPSINDINQGQLGDCYFLASLAGIAEDDPSLIESSIASQGNGKYGVTFYVGGQAKVVTVDSGLPTIVSSNVFEVVNGVTVAGKQVLGNDAYANMTSLWANLMEKAYAVLNSNSYAAIGNGGSADTALKELTNASVTDYSGASILSSAQTIINAVNNKQVVVLTSATNTKDTTGNDGAKIGAQDLVSSHCLTVTGYDAATGQLVVRNPWGADSGASGGANGAGAYNTSFEVSLTQIASIRGDSLSVSSLIPQTVAKNSAIAMSAGLLGVA